MKNPTKNIKCSAGFENKKGVLLRYLVSVNRMQVLKIIVKVMIMNSHPILDRTKYILV
tara:strand:- start:330 stop:503 length:174 start_codon:yes stop_codon:yes gene_type:complete